MTQGEKRRKEVFPSLEQAKAVWGRMRRLPGRVAPRVQETIDHRVEALGEWLDRWNRGLAERAIPPERKARVQSRGRSAKARLKVVSADESESRSSRSGS